MPTAKRKTKKQLNKEKIAEREQLARKKYNEIKEFVSFNISDKKKIHPSTQKKIARYWSGVRELSRSRHAGYKVYKPRKKENLKKAQKFSHGDIHLNELSVAFVPTNGDGKNAKIRFNKNSMVVIEQNISRHFIAFNKKKFLKDPTGHAKKQLKDNPAKNYQIAAGAHFIKQTQSSVNACVKRIDNLINTYNDPDDNHYFGNWLVGVYGYEFHNQKDIAEYKEKRSKNRRAKTGRIIYNKKQAIKNVKKKVQKNIKK